MKRGWLARSVVAVMMAAGGLFVTASPASAACAFQWQDTNGNSSASLFTIAGAWSSCNDMNFGNSSFNQTYRGGLKNPFNGVWNWGAWINRPTNSGNYVVAYANAWDGFPARAVGCCVNAHIWVMH